MHRGEAMMSLAWLVIFEQAELNQFPHREIKTIIHTPPNSHITNKNAVHLNAQRLRWDLLGVDLDHWLFGSDSKKQNETTPKNSYIAQV
jgi:hypothetical protein